MPIPFAAAAPVIGAGITALGGLANSFIGRKTSKDNTRRTIEAQKELAEYSYSKDLEMWNRANEYNSPEQQMARLKNANLNPNLIYGSGSVAGNTSTQTPKYQQYDPQYKTAPLQLPDVLGVLGAFQDVKAKQAQVENIKKSTERKEIENILLPSILGNKDMKMRSDAHISNYLKMKLSGELGLKGSESLMDSPYFKQYQATTQQRVQDNMLKKLELDFYKQLGVGSTGMGQIMQGLKFFLAK